MGYILGPKLHVAMAILVRLLLAMTMEIWDSECGPFWGNFCCFCDFSPRREQHNSLEQGT